MLEIIELLIFSCRLQQTHQWSGIINENIANSGLRGKIGSLILTPNNCLIFRVCYAIHSYGN